MNDLTFEEQKCVSFLDFNIELNGNKQIDVISTK